MRLSATLFRYALRFGVLLAVLPTSARAQTPGSCAPGEAVGTLNVSDVQARLFNGGNLFYGPGYTSGNGYEVPHVLGACGGFLCSPVFAANFWVAGTVSSTLRTAAATYQRFEFWPGPLDPGATLPNPSDCSGYDRIYVVSTTDVETYENGGPATPDLAEWPVGLGAPAVDAMGNPVIPTSREQVINLAAGERPVIHGSQTAFWVMNDVGNVHAESKSAPLGVEVQVLAFAINSTETALNQATVYRYRLINRNSALIDSARVGVWMDSDLGAALDDFIHFDTTRSMMAFYNAANTDVIYGSPPALGIDLFDGAVTGIYSPDDSGPRGDPTTRVEFSRVLNGRWKDGTPLTEGGTGYQTGGTIVPFAFPGDPVTDTYWSEENPNNGPGQNAGGDRRGTITWETFDLAPGEARDLSFAVLFAWGTNRLDSVTRLRAASDRVQTAYDDGTLWNTVPVAAESAPPAQRALTLHAPAPNPAEGYVEAVVETARAGRVRVALYDVLGREVAVLTDGTRAAGRHALTLDARTLPAGTYLLVAEADGARAARRLSVVR